LVTRLFLVRHGETEWNAAHRIQGQTDVPLNEQGLRQASAVAAYLAAESLTAVYASNLSRARQTAEAIAAVHGLPVHLAPELREVDFGEWEGLDEAAIAARFPEEYRLWREDSLRHRPPGGETIAALRARAAQVYDRVVAAHAGETVALVGHGGSIRALVLHAIGLPLEAYSRLRMRNAAVSLVEIGDRGPVLARFNHTCFLEE
jgi:alpha-ribazole phosphatase